MYIRRQGVGFDRLVPPGILLTTPLTLFFCPNTIDSGGFTLESQPFWGGDGTNSLPSGRNLSWCEDGDCAVCRRALKLPVRRTGRVLLRNDSLAAPSSLQRRRTVIVRGSLHRKKPRESPTLTRHVATK